MFTKHHIIDWSKLKAFSGEIYRQDLAQMIQMKICHKKDRKHCEKGRKIRLSLFSPFPAFFFFFNPLPDDKILDWSKLKLIAEDILKCI